MKIHALLALFSSAVFASEPDDTLISEIIANEHVCVRAYVDDRIYLDPAKIVPTDDGIFLNLSNRNYLPLPMLYSDQDGCYIQLASSQNVASECPLCGKKYVGWCSNADCPGKAKVKKYEEEKQRKNKEYKEKKKKEKF